MTDPLLWLYNHRDMKASPQKTEATVPQVSGIRLQPADRKAIAEIIDAGFAHSTASAIRFALQRAIRWVRDQEKAA